MHMIAKLISFLSGGQTDFLIPLSHQWHGVNVAPALDLVAFGAALITVGLLVNCIWCALRRRPFGIAFILMLATATAAYAASSTLGNLSSGSAISATDLFYDVQSVGTGGVKVTGTQLTDLGGHRRPDRPRHDGRNMQSGRDLHHPNGVKSGHHHQRQLHLVVLRRAGQLQ